MSCQKNYNILLQQNKTLTKQVKQNNSNNSLNKFNSMIEKASQSISCDDECQKKTKNK